MGGRARASKRRCRRARRNIALSSKRWGRVIASWNSFAMHRGEPSISVTSNSILICLICTWNGRKVGLSCPSLARLHAGAAMVANRSSAPCHIRLKAKTSYELGADGVHCTIAVPISRATREGV